MIFAVILALSLMIPKLKYFFYFIAIIVSLSRVVVGAHFLTDIISGGAVAFIGFKFSKLIIGDIKSTSKDFFLKSNPAPIGAIVYDFDFYSSTKVAMSMLKADSKFFLPRIYYYFDDVIGSETELYNDFTGERLAINEFNAENNDIKLSPAYHHLAQATEVWHHQIWVYHLFKHEHYNSFISEPNQQL